MEVALSPVDEAELVQRVIWLNQNVILKLHRLEEKLIYTKLEANPRLSEGGPYCTLYYDNHITNPPSKLVRTLTGADLEWESHHLQFKNSKTSLLIPLEEHRALKALAEYMLQHQLAKPDFDKVYSAFASLLELHLTKEARCFFRVCQALLTAEDLDRIAEQWESISLP